MKRVIFLFLIVVFEASGQSVHSFSKNNLFFEGSVGLGIYDTQLYDRVNLSVDYDKAAAWLFPFWMEYGLGNRHGIAGGFRYSSYIIGKTDTANRSADIYSYDACFRYLFYPVRSRFYSLAIGPSYGWSSFTFNVNDAAASRAEGTGSVFALNLINRLFIFRNVGLTLNYSYQFYHYQPLVVRDNVQAYSNLDFYLRRGNVSLGIIVRILGRE